MKSFQVTIRMGCSDIEDSGFEDDALENWLQEKLQDFAFLFDGHGQVRVERVDPLKIDVKLTFGVHGESVVDVLNRYTSDFGRLASIAQGIDVRETKLFKLCFPTVGGERFPVFIRVNPETGRLMYTED